MTFLNTKEEVYEVVLSKHGKRKLSQGKFDPKFFSFVDDDVQYDLRYSGIEVSQSQLEDHILSAPRLKENAVDSYRGYEDVFKEENFEYNSLFSLNNLGLIGSTKSSELYAPSWLIKSLKGSGMTLEESEPLEDQDSNFENKSLLNFDLGVRDVVISKEISFEKARKEKNLEEILDNAVVFSDDSAIIVEDDFILLDFSEKNVGDVTEHFEYFVGEYQGEEDIPALLKLLEEENYVVEGKLIVDDRAILKKVEDAKLIARDSSFADYYFEFLSDGEVDERAKKILCDTYKKELHSGFLSRILPCKEKVPMIRKPDIYRSKVKPEEVREKCE
jgi:hypothetical protein